MIAGLKFGRFQALRELGRGAMGVVYLAADPNDLQPVAVKLLQSPLPAFEARFKREFRVLQKLSSPHVVGVLEFGALSTGSFIAMEFVEGTNLEGWLPHAPESPEELRRVIRLLSKLADGLGAVHRAGVIHRDLKPENVLVTPDDTPKLTDFGLARDDTASVALTVAGKGGFMGTLSYAAPEQIQSRGVDHRADLYAFGMLMYRLFTGRTAFEGQPISQIVLSHLREAPLPPSQLNPQISAPLEELILHLLAKTPAERPDSADAVRERLEGLLKETEENPAPNPATSVSLEGTDAARSLLEPPFVGREALLGAILRAPTNAVLLRGEAGVGKSRLLLELRRERQLRGYRTLNASVSSGAPLEIIAQWLRAALQKPSARLSALMETDGAVLANLVPEIGVPPLPLTGEQAQFTLYAGALRVLNAETNDQPLLLTLENAGRADEGSLNFIAYALRSARQGERLTFALTAQRETPNHALHALETEGLIASFNVLPLQPDDTRHAIRATLGGLVDDALVEHVAVRSGGNPWMAGEILRALIEAGEAFRYRRYWEWTRVSAGLTPSLSETLRDRAANLSPSAQDLAATAAAIGDTLSFEALSELSGREEEALLDDLDQLIRARILLEERVGREEVYRFAHPLLRDAALEGMSIRKRRRLHARYAEILVARDADPALLAEHLLQSEQTDAAFAATLRAAKKAEALYLLPTLEHLIRRTLTLLESADARRDILEIYLGRIGSQIGRSSEAGLFLEGVFERDGTEAMNARVALAELYQRTSRWREAIELLAPVIETSQNMVAWRTLISAYRFSGQPEVALTCADKAEEIIAPSEALTAFLAQQRATAMFVLHRIEESKAQCDIALQAAERVSDLFTLSATRVILGQVYQWLQEPEQELRCYREAAQSFRLIGDVRGSLSAELNASATLMDLEDFDAAVEMFLEVRQKAEKSGFHDLMANASFNLADCYAGLGEDIKADEYLEQARALAVRIDDKALIENIEELRLGWAREAGTAQL